MSFRIYKRVAPGLGISGKPLEMLALSVFEGILDDIGTTVAGTSQAAPKTYHSDYFHDMETPEAPTLRQQQAERKELASLRLQKLRNGKNPYTDLYQ